MKYTPYPHQAEFLSHALNSLETHPQGSTFLYYAPTGAGKSLCELLLKEAVPGSWLLTPRIEIVVGLLDKLGHQNPGEMSLPSLVALAESERITTPIRFRNNCANGVQAEPTLLIYDESHHEEASTYRQIDAYMPGCTKVGLTATPYRGTPSSTESFIKRWSNNTWGKPFHPILTMRDAVQKRIIALPKFTIWPLLDDDEVKIVNGEFQALASDSSRSLMEELAHTIKEQNWFTEGKFDRPTMIAVSTTDQAKLLTNLLTEAGLPAELVIQSTTRPERNQAFERTVNRDALLVQIDVVSEGVDLPIRRIVDCSATMSPVRFKQRAGRCERITREDEPQPEYICCNRNLERHIYLYEGLVPPAVIKQSQEKFGKPSSRSSATRAMGLETLGRFKAAELPFKDGTTGHMYSVYTVEESADGLAYIKREYAAIVHPCYPPVYATRTTSSTPSGERTYGRWQKVKALPELTGYSSTPPASITDKQRNRWRLDAAFYGLDASAEVTRKNIQALFVLKDTNQRFKS